MPLRAEISNLRFQISLIDPHRIRNILKGILKVSIIRWRNGDHVKQLAIIQLSSYKPNAFRATSRLIRVAQRGPNGCSST